MASLLFEVWQKRTGDGSSSQPRTPPLSSEAGLAAAARRVALSSEMSSNLTAPSRPSGKLR